jgi:hypothetical protein
MGSFLSIITLLRLIHSKGSKPVQKLQILGCRSLNDDSQIHVVPYLPREIIHEVKWVRGWRKRKPKRE